MYTFYEFFAGGGMARLGLGKGWKCLFANDMDEKKAAAYRANFHPARELSVSDVASLKASQLPGDMAADLAWASFPCQDLSLAGPGAGLGGVRSGSYWPFCGLMGALKAESRAPKLIVLENVPGALTSRRGKDFSAIAASLAAIGYEAGALIADARHFTPQSRPRLFVIAVRDDLAVPRGLTGKTPLAAWHPGAVVNAVSVLPGAARKKWIWWKLPPPPGRQSKLADLIEENPKGVRWRTSSQTQRLLAMMSPAHLAKVAEAGKSGARAVGAVYKRTRRHKGEKVQRAEVRFDHVAGCLRTPAGGSSRQEIIIVEGEDVKTRLLSPREAARLMGLPEDYRLPEKYNDAYGLAGDGVAAPVVRFLAENILEPLLDANKAEKRKAAA